MDERRIKMEETPRMTRSRIVAALVAALALSLASSSSAIGSEPIDSFATTSSTAQAGGHPDLETTFTLHSPGQPESAKNVIFNAPQGIFGNPNAIIRCQPADFALDQCPPNSQAGLITVYANYEGNPNFLLGTAPLYDVQPGAEYPALLEFTAPTLEIPISIPVAVRTGADYGLRFTVKDITQIAPLGAAHLVIWGFPADPSHDGQRYPKGSPGHPAGCVGLATPCGAGASASEPNRPLTDNPTVCTGEELVTTLDVQTYQDPGNPSHAESSYPAIEECERENFNPVLHASLTTDETDSPSGLNIDLKAPQFESFAASPSEIKSATVALPEGLTINPDAADGQTSCSDAQANFGSEGPANCPDNSKIGTFQIGSPALDGPLTGSVYIGQPLPGSQYRLFMIASGFGINAKLLGAVKPDAATGRVKVDFESLPAVPFDDFQVHLFASDRGLMATPTSCSSYDIESDFFPWNTALADQTSTAAVILDSGPNGAPCPGQVRPFHPSLAAGASNPNAGAFASFSLKLDRNDGDQFLGDLNFTLPTGFTGDLRGISYCPEASIAAAAARPGLSEEASPSCPASSLIGTTNVAAGPGGHPFHAVGRMYMAGPFKGAPLSLAAITPALAGPYDYGTVVVRVALHVDQADAHVTAISDTVPRIIGGIPLRLRSIRVNLDRPNFTINPTDCNPLSVDSQGIGDQATIADFGSYFNAVNCGHLGFSPKMTIRQMGGRGATKRSADPSLRFDLNTQPGDANVKRVVVTLPNAFEIDQTHLGNLCAKLQLERERCAGRQPIGAVETKTPLLDKPLKGHAYAVSGFGGLPHVAFVLNGQVPLVPQAESSSIGGGRLKTVVPVIPDAPIGHFRLTLLGGSKGYLANTRSLCASAAAINVQYVAYNGKRLTQHVEPKTACGQKRSHKRHARRSHR
jgi:hypothetical protein